MKVVNLDDIRHGIRVANFSIGLAKSVHMPRVTIGNLYISCLFHDIGKAHIDQIILNKKGQLTDREKAIIREHPLRSYEEVLTLGYPEEVAQIILYHHENWNGTGYPKGLVGQAIPFGSRILRLSDVFDALTMDRPYRKSLSIHEALSIMDNEREFYDPELYRVFTRMVTVRYKDILYDQGGLLSHDQRIQVNSGDLYL